MGQEACRYIRYESACVPLNPMLCAEHAQGCRSQGAAWASRLIPLAGTPSSAPVLGRGNGRCAWLPVRTCAENGQLMCRSLQLELHKGLLKPHGAQEACRRALFACFPLVVMPSRCSLAAAMCGNRSRLDVRARLRIASHLQPLWIRCHVAQQNALDSIDMHHKLDCDCRRPLVVVAFVLPRF